MSKTLGPNQDRAVAPSSEEARRRFAQLLHRDLALLAFFDAADRTLGSLVPFDASCWLSLDPATALPTSQFSRVCGNEHLMALAANEFLEDDVNKIAELAHSRRPVGTLSQATGGDLRRSARYSGVLEPNGYGGDELRAAFRDGESVWGCLIAHRRLGTFTEDEADMVADVGGQLAQGIRRAILRTALTADAGPDAPGLIILRPDDSVESLTPAARHWLSEILDTTTVGSAVLPLTIRSVAHQARGAASGLTEELASALLPRRSGGWLRADASLLDEEVAGRVGIVIHPARDPEVATLIAEAYGLSARERELTGLVLRGYSTHEIATLLHVSPYTVQDHLKSIFDKVDVRSRRELVARLFLQQCAPRLQAGTLVAPDGWFADDHVAPTGDHTTVA